MDKAAQYIGTGASFSRPWRALKPDAQAFDEIKIITVPRYKESGLSGDEWRISATVQFYRKGRLVHEVGARDVEHACRYLAWYHASACDDGKAFFGGERDICDQEGCSQPATVALRLKQKYCRDGHPHELHNVTYRLFCNQHKTRGDCGLDDADANYEPMDMPPTTTDAAAGGGDGT